jgi:hypothetical protein
MSSLALPTGQRGQATVEHVGMVALLALLLSAIALWLVREVRPPDHPPRFIDAAAQPLVSADSWVGQYVNPLAGLQPWRAPRGREDEPIGRVLRAGGRAGLVALQGVPAFGQGAWDRLTEHLDAILDDPLGAALQSLRESWWIGVHPDEAVRQLAREMRDYVEELRRLGPRGAYLKLAHDAGGEALDAALSRGGAAVRRLILRRLAGHLPDLPAPPEEGSGGRSGSP